MPPLDMQVLRLPPSDAVAWTLSLPQSEELGDFDFDALQSPVDSRAPSPTDSVEEYPPEELHILVRGFQRANAYLRDENLKLREEIGGMLDQVQRAKAALAAQEEHERLAAQHAQATEALLAELATVNKVSGELREVLPAFVGECGEVLPLLREEQKGVVTQCQFHNTWVAKEERLVREASVGLRQLEQHAAPVRRQLLVTQLMLAAMVLFLLFLVYETGGAAVAPVTGRVTAGLEALRRVAEDALAYALSACRRQSCDAEWRCHWHCTLLG